MGYDKFMYLIIQSDEFSNWLKALKDAQAKARILARITSAQGGNFGDSQAVGEGISEMRVHVGAGYRVYYIRTDKTVICLLCGGDKSTQDKDIKRAKALAATLKGVNDDGKQST
jgi:putative addiction module killer protein